MTKEALKVEHITHSFGRGAPAVDHVDLSLETGRFFCLLGPSGCGKTTLLRLIGGYLRPDKGEIFLAGKNITRLPPEKREMGMVFQNYALFPHLSARKNVAFGLEVRNVPRKERHKRTEEILDRVGLSPEERERRPKELSGGQQQRVALARALVIEPQILLLDEPFANLDRRLRDKLRGELKEIQGRTKITTLLVTHDQEEAFALADQVGLMLAGRFLQIDSPQNLYHRPRFPFVARFVGEANLLTVEEILAEEVRLAGGLSLRHQRLPGLKPGVTLLIRPEQVRFGPAAEACPNHWEGTTRGATFLGTDLLLDIEVTPEVTLRARSRVEGTTCPAAGERLTVGFPSEGVWVIPESDPPWVANLHKEQTP